MACYDNIYVMCVELYYKLSGNSHRCNSTLYIQFKCDDGYGIVVSKNKSKKRNKMHFKQHVKRKCKDDTGKLLMHKVPKCVFLKSWSKINMRTKR